MLMVHSRSLQARGSDADLHGAGNGRHMHTLIDMVIVAPAKCMHKTYLQGGGNSLFQ